MARGGLVHPLPLFKERPCTEWIEPVDLTTVLTPGVEETLTLPPYELVRDGSAYFLENEDRPTERYDFWSVGRGFDENMPGEGMLILHSDTTCLPESQPLPPPNGLHYQYLIVQADGEHELEDGTDCGDDGDPWPGSIGNMTFNCYTEPGSTWNAYDRCTGLDIRHITTVDPGTITLRLSWVPMSIPSLKFIDPPGGSSVGVPPDVIYRIRSELNDLYGATDVRFFFATDQGDLSIDPDGANFIGMVRKLVPGTVSQAADWNITGLPDGAYRVFAELIPGVGDDGAEASGTTPRRGRYNAGDGTLTVSAVDTNEVTARGESGFLLDPVTFVAFEAPPDLVDFAELGVTVGDQLMSDGLEFPAFKPALRTIVDITPDGSALTLSAPVVGALPPGGAGWVITKGGRAARFETWLVECVDEAGVLWQVTSSLSQPEGGGQPHALTNVPYTAVGNEVGFTITEGSRPFERGDTFVFSTTGITAPSRCVLIVNGQILETFGDWNGDGLVDLSDYGAFAPCLDLSGPGLPAPSDGCRAVFDFNGDDDVDLGDFRAFLATFEKAAR
jgi:hypothetical protein